MLLTCFGRESRLVGQQAADPSHHVVDVLRRWQLDLLAVLVDPGVVESDAGAHRRVVLHRAELGDDAVELVDVVEEVEDCHIQARGSASIQPGPSCTGGCVAGPVLTIHRDPFPRVDVLWQHDDRLEAPLDQRRAHERVAQVERLACWLPERLCLRLLEVVLLQRAEAALRKARRIWCSRGALRSFARPSCPPHRASESSDEGVAVSLTRHVLSRERGARDLAHPIELKKLISASRMGLLRICMGKEAPRLSPAACACVCRACDCSATLLCAAFVPPRVPGLRQSGSHDGGVQLDRAPASPKRSLRCLSQQSFIPAWSLALPLSCFVDWQPMRPLQRVGCARSLARRSTRVAVADGEARRRRNFSTTSSSSSLAAVGLTVHPMQRRPRTEHCATSPHRALAHAHTSLRAAIQSLSTLDFAARCGEASSLTIYLILMHI